MPTNTQRIAALEALTATHTAQIADLDDRVTALESPVIPPSGPAVYGTAFKALDKGNYEIRRGKGGFKFRCTHSGTVKYIRFAATNRAVPYGGGDGGIYRVGIQGVAANGFADGSWIGQQVTWDPVITTGAFLVYLTFSAGPSLTSGTDYVIVIENIHSSDPQNNWTSLNLPWFPTSAGIDSPLQPMYPDDENVYIHAATNQGQTGVWTRINNHLPAFDLEYADGAHEGMAGIMGSGDSFNYVGTLSSSSVLRWTWTHPTSRGSITVDALNWWLLKNSGSTDATVVVKQNGSTVASGVLASSGEMAAGSRSWQRAPLSVPVDIDPGDAMEVIVSATAGSWSASGMLWRDSYASPPQAMQSFPYTEDGGSHTHRAYTGSAGTTLVQSAWAAHFTYMAYLEVA